MQLSPIVVTPRARRLLIGSGEPHTHAVLDLRLRLDGRVIAWTGTSAVLLGIDPRLYSRRELGSFRSER